MQRGVTFKIHDIPSDDSSKEEYTSGSLSDSMFAVPLEELTYEEAN